MTYLILDFTLNANIVVFTVVETAYRIIEVLNIY